MQRIHHLVSRLESSTLLERIADQLAAAARPLLSRRAVNDALTGRWLGHSVHPMVVSLPIGCFTSAAVLDMTGSALAARRLIGVGVLAVVPTALTGTADWLDTSGAERRVGTAHALANDMAATAFAASWIARRSGRRALGVALSTAGLASLGAAGYLGGHLVYARGVGVNTTSFQSGPEEWRRLVPLDEVDADALRHQRLDGLSLVIGHHDGHLFVMEDRCTHRGGPLSDGRVAAGCIECPWHASRFDLEDGTVRKGPASIPQPVYQSRVNEGWIEIRRDEPGGLRSNAVDAGPTSS